MYLCVAYGGMYVCRCSLRSVVGPRKNIFPRVLSSSCSCFFFSCRVYFPFIQLLKLKTPHDHAIVSGDKYTTNEKKIFCHQKINSIFLSSLAVDNSSVFESFGIFTIFRKGYELRHSIENLRSEKIYSLLPGRSFHSS